MKRNEVIEEEETVTQVRTEPEEPEQVVICNKVSLKVGDVYVNIESEDLGTETISNMAVQLVGCLKTMKAVPGTGTETTTQEEKNDDLDSRKEYETLMKGIR